MFMFSSISSHINNVRKTQISGQTAKIKYKYSNKQQPTGGPDLPCVSSMAVDGARVLYKMKMEGDDGALNIKFN